MTLEQLLVVQTHDSAIDRLAYQRENLPEFTALANIADEAAHLETERTVLRGKRHDLDRAQKRLEDDAALITDRIDLENTRLYDGSITAIKDLQAIQDELVVLGRRRDDLEDQILELMEAGEPIDAGIAEFDAKLAEVDSRRHAVTEALATSQAAIDAEIEAEREHRAEAAAAVAPSLLAEYEQTRADLGGVGVSRLVDKTCEGCHLQLSAVELDRVRKEPADAVVRCAECTRILVR